MKKILFFTLLVTTTCSVAYSNYSMLVCNAQRGTTIQVYLNGKLINKKAASIVRLKSNDGCNSISVTIYNTECEERYSVQRDIDIEAGYEVYFQTGFDDCGAKLVTSRRYPLLNTYSYSKKLYAKRYIS